MNFLDKKLEQQKERALKRKRGPVPKNHRRYKFKLLDQKALAYKVQIDDVEYWMPISKVKIGIHPTGHWYCIDVPEWLVKQKGLPTTIRK